MFGNIIINKHITHRKLNYVNFSVSQRMFVSNKPRVSTFAKKHVISICR